MRRTLLTFALIVLPVFVTVAQPLWIENGGRQIYGVLNRPIGKEGRLPIAIVSHGFNGTYHFAQDYFGPLAELGWMTYAFDFPCGSVNSRSDSNTMNMSILDEQSDLRAIVNYFRHQPYVDPNRIMLIGESQGGLVSALTAAQMNKEVSHLVLIYPALCIPNNWNSRYPKLEDIPDTTRLWNVPMGRRFFEELRTMDAFRTMKNFQKPVLIIQGDADQVVSVDDSRRAAQTYKNARLYVIPSAGHGFKPKERKEAIEQIKMLITETTHSPSTKHPMTAKLFTRRLQQLVKHGIMFGHQDDPFYGLGWQWEQGRSDVLETCGDYPAVMGFDLGGIEMGDEKNLDSVPFTRIREEILAQVKRGGIVTISWHPRNPVTTIDGGGNAGQRYPKGSAWDVSDKMVVRSVLPSGEKYGLFQTWLSRLTAFLASLHDEQGHAVPFVFRPWHENSGGWFWWGRGLCSAEEYKALWNMTQDYVTRSLPYNILWSWSPNYGFTPDALDTYPGHDRVDIIGLDAYQQRDGEQAFINQLKKDLTTLSALAREGKRQLALTECGYQNIPDPTWWTRVLLPQLKPWPLSYFLVWRNADHKQYFAPAPETADAEDFREMVKDKKILMLKDLAK